MPQHFHQSFDARIPKLFIRTQPVIRATKWTWIDAHIVNAPANGAFHQTRAFQGQLRINF